MTLQDPLVGRVLDGRYRVESRVAVGGMATVYRAVDTRLDRLLALKVMHPGLAADTAFVERFIREAKAVAGLDHANVISVFDQGTDGTYVYLAMEYVAGCTLRDVLRERGALCPRAALDILEPVLAALGAAHRAGLVHRDMKPENVLIGEDGRVKVADFGLVRAVDTHTTASSGSVLGTVSYMAPEQIGQGTADPRSDVYACGMLLHEMLTGARPRNGGTPAQVIYQHLNEDVAPPSAAVPGLAAELDALVALAAARDPELRPADAVELLARLRAARLVLTDEELDAMPPASAPAAGPEDRTSVLPRTAPRGPDPDEALNRTSRLPVPPDEAARFPRRPRATRRALTALAAAVVLVLCLGGVWYVAEGRFTVTPSVLGLERAEAVRILADAGLEAKVAEAFSETVAKGRVISTDPANGERIRTHATVRVVVSKGPERVKVPDVTGRTLAAAREELTEARLTPGTVTRQFSGSVPRGSVIRTDPGKGTALRPDAAVAITVSRGAPVDVPEVIGRSVADAQEALRESGLKARLAEERAFSDRAGKGDVARQSPGGGTQLAEGDSVTLTLSKGQELFEVPDVDGMDEDEAVRILEAAGFEVSAKHPVLGLGGTVFSQSPSAGEMAPKGTTITLWVR